MREEIIKINYLQLIGRKWKLVLFITSVVLLLSLVTLLLQPFWYGSTAKVYVIQRSSLTFDAYSASKSAERIANNLGEIVKSSTFFNDVSKSGFAINQDYFPKEEKERRDLWGKIIKTKVPSGLQTLEITAYHEDPLQAEQLVNAVAYVLTTKGVDYIGVADVELKIIEPPLTSQYPVKPNILAYLFLGVFVGLLFGVFGVILAYANQPIVIEIEEVEKLPSWRERRRVKKLNKKRSKILKLKEEPVEEVKAVKPKLNIITEESIEEDQPELDINNIISDNDQLRNQNDELDVDQEQSVEQDYGDLGEFGGSDKIVTMPVKDQDK